MVKSKSLCSKITIISILIIMTLIIALSSIFLTNNVYAEEAGAVATSETNKEYGIYASASYNILANGGHQIGTVTMKLSTCLRETGDGMILMQLEVAPRVDDGANDYKVIQFNTNLAYGADNGGITYTSWKDNSSAKLVDSSGNVVSNRGVTFNVGSNFSSSYGVRNVNVFNKDDPSNSYSLNKISYISLENPAKDMTYTYQIAFFFKAKPKDLTIFYAEMYNLQVDGIFLAPDYGANNNENIFLWGLYSTEKKEFSIENNSSTHTGKDDGSPNDTLSLVNFDTVPFVR